MCSNCGNVSTDYSIVRRRWFCFQCVKKCLSNYFESTELLEENKVEKFGISLEEAANCEKVMKKKDKTIYGNFAYSFEVVAYKANDILKLRQKKRMAALSQELLKKDLPGGVVYDPFFWEWIESWKNRVMPKTIVHNYIQLIWNKYHAQYN